MPHYKYATTEICYHFFFPIKCDVHFYTQRTYNIKMKIQYKKITTHALNLMDYNPKNTIRFLK